jgi:hypothetical protein
LVMCLFSVLGLRRNEDLWRTKGVTVKYPGKKHGLGYKRWRLINAHLKFDDKVIHQLLRQAFQSHMEPGREMTVDESRIRCKDKSCEYLVWNKEKPAKWALESLSLSDSTKYLYDFTNPISDQKPTPFEWLLECARLLKAKGKSYHLTADKRFSSLAQVLSLEEIGIPATLCCKSNSPTWLFGSCLTQGLNQWRVHVASSDQVVAACYHQNKKLCLVSTAFEVIESTDTHEKSERYYLTTMTQQKDGQISSINWQQTSSMDILMTIGESLYCLVGLGGLTPMHIYFSNTLLKTQLWTITTS